MKNSCLQWDSIHYTNTLFKLGNGMYVTWATYRMNNNDQVRREKVLLVLCDPFLRK